MARSEASNNLTGRWIDHVTEGINGNNGAHYNPADLEAGAAEPGFHCQRRAEQLSNGGASAGPHVALGASGSPGRTAGFVAHLCIGSDVFSPQIQVIEDCGRDDGDLAIPVENPIFRRSR